MTTKRRQQVATEQCNNVPDSTPGRSRRVQARETHVNLVEFANVRPRQRTGIKPYDLLEEMLLYCPDKEEAISLNGSAKAIFKLCNGDYTIAEIGRILAKQLGCIDNELLLSELLSDVRAGVFELAKCGLLDLQGSPRA